MKNYISEIIVVVCLLIVGATVILYQLDYTNGEVLELSKRLLYIISSGYFVKSGAEKCIDKCMDTYAKCKFDEYAKAIDKIKNL